MSPSKTIVLFYSGLLMWFWKDSVKMSYEGNQFVFVYLGNLYQLTYVFSLPLCWRLKFQSHKWNRTCLSINRNGSCFTCWLTALSTDVQRSPSWSTERQFLRRCVQMGISTTSAQLFQACSPSVILINAGKLLDIYVQLARQFQKYNILL